MDDTPMYVYIWTRRAILLLTESSKKLLYKRRMPKWQWYYSTLATAVRKMNAKYLVVKELKTAQNPALR